MTELEKFFPEIALFDHFFTGSRCIGGATNKSDWDYCFHSDQEQEIRTILKQNNLNFKETGSGYDNISIKFSIFPKFEELIGFGPFNECVFNFIFLDDVNFIAWRETTKFVIEITKKSRELGVIKSEKCHRIYLFESIKQYLGSTS